MTTVMVTDMWLLPRVSSRMDRQCTTLDETLIAVLDGTMIGALIRMYAIMSAEIRFAIEGLPVQFSLVGLAIGVPSGRTGAWVELPFHNAPKSN